ncbi:MAG: hypothetical protein V1707_01415 [bacterium]
MNIHQDYLRQIEVSLLAIKAINQVPMMIEVNGQTVDIRFDPYYDPEFVHERLLSFWQDALAKVTAMVTISQVNDCTFIIRDADGNLKKEKLPFAQPVGSKLFMSGALLLGVDKKIYEDIYKEVELVNGQLISVVEIPVGNVIEYHVRILLNCLTGLTLQLS